MKYPQLHTYWKQLITTLIGGKKTVANECKKVLNGCDDEWLSWYYEELMNYEYEEEWLM